MKSVSIRIVAFVALAIAGVACSKGSGTSAGSGGSTTTTSGVFQVPDTKCGTSACMSAPFTLNADGDVSSLLANSSEQLVAYGQSLYTYFDSTTIPAINTQLARIDAAFYSNGITTCEMAAAAPTGTNQSIGDGFTVDIAAGDKTLPAGFNRAGETTGRRYVVKQNGTAFANVQVHCGDGFRTLYVRATVSPNTFEAWAQTTTNYKLLYAAMDDATTKRTMYFFSDSPTKFKMLAVANNITFNGGTVSAAIGGDINIATGVGEIAFATGATSPSALTRSANDAAWVGANIRHCYSSLTTAAVDAAGTTCNSATIGAVTPGATPLRGGAAWSVTGMNTAVSTTFP